MRVCLINPPYSIDQSIREVANITEPLGLAYIAAVLEKNNFKVEIIDCGIEQIYRRNIYNFLFKSLKKKNPDIIGIYTNTPGFSSVLRIARWIKNNLSNSIIVLGGPHVTAVPTQTMSYCCFDIGVLGEGEYTFLELVKHVEKKNLIDLKKIRGVVYKKIRKIIFTKTRQFVKNLDEIPFPARHLLPPLLKYKPTPISYRKLPLGNIITTRGCPYRCTFCSRAIFGSSYRERSPDNVLDEMEELIYTYGAREIRFWDDTFTLNQDRVSEICKKIKERGIKIQWTCLSRVNEASKKLFKTMKHAGCWQVLFGIESGSQRVLNFLKKDITLRQIRRAVKLANDCGLRVRADILYGTPGETKESMRKTLNFVKTLNIDVIQFNKFTPYPGTEIFKNLTEKGHSFNFLNGWSQNYYKDAIYVHDGISKGQYLSFITRSYKEFYFNPKYLFNQLKSIRSFSDTKKYFQGFLAICKM